MMLLCNDILERIAPQEKLPEVPEVDWEAVNALSRAIWPENVSDLIRVLESAVRESEGGTIRLEHLEDRLPDEALLAGVPSLDEVLARAQRAAIQNALDQTGGSVLKAARLLRRNRGALHRLMAKLGMIRKRRAPVKPK